MTNIFINFDKELFISKNAIKRLKDDLRKGSEIKSENYIKDSNIIVVTKENDNIVLTTRTSEKKSKEDKRNELRQRLKMMRDKRGNSHREKLNEIKRTVPKNIFKKYTNILNKYGFNIPSPDEIMNNPEKFKQQISMMASDFSKVSDDGQANSALKSYFKSFAELFDIDPMQFNVPQNNPTQNLHQMINNDEDTEDEDDEPPELIPS